MTRHLFILLLATLFIAIGTGCAATSFKDGSSGTTTPVLAEYRGLENRKVAVLIRQAEPTLRPMLGYELSASLSLRLQDRIPGISVINPDRVRAYQKQNPKWSDQPYAHIARALEADRLLVVLIEDYRLQDDQHLRWQSRIEAQIEVVEADAKNPEKLAAQFDIQTQYPQKPHELSAIRNERTLRLASGQEFSIAVTNKFYDHSIWRSD